MVHIQAAEENAIIVAEWRVTKTELMRVIIREYQGRQFIDVRRWYYDATRKLSPGRKGVSLRLDDIPLLRKALRKAERKIERKLGR